MVSSFSSPDCSRFQKFTRGSFLVPNDEVSCFDTGSSGISAGNNESSAELSGFFPDSGAGFSVVKNEKSSEPNGLFFGPGPGISMSRPLLINDAACVAPQSDVTNPLKPNSSRRILTSVSGFPHAYVPLILLYEHMIDETSAFTAST